MPYRAVPPDRDALAAAAPGHGTRRSTVRC